MATEAKESNPGDFILSLVSLGESLMADLLLFASRWPTGYDYIMDLISDGSRTITTLKKIGEAINKLDGELIITGGPLMDICKCVLSDFQKLKGALDHILEKMTTEDIVLNVIDSWVSVGGAKRLDSAIHMTGKNSGPARNPDPSELIEEELGGRVKADELRLNLLDAMDHLWNFGPALTFMALKKQEKENTLSPAESKELKILTSGVQETLERVEAWKPNTVRFAARYKAIHEVQKFGHARDSPAAEVREFGVSERVRRDIDDDGMSVTSFNSDASCNWKDIKELHEAWIVKNVTPRISTERTWTVFGIPAVRQLWEGPRCTIEASLLPDEMESDVSSDQTETAEVARKESVDKITSSWPDQVSRDVEYLLEDRRRSTIRSRFPREWKIWDIKPKYVGLPLSNQGWKSWWQPSREPNSWLIILKATTVGKNKPFIIDRFDDPFLKRPQRLGVYERGPRRQLIEPRRPEPPNYIPPSGLRAPRPYVRPVWEHKERTPEEVEADLVSVVAELTGGEACGATDDD